MVSRVRRAQEAKEHWPELECATCEAEGGGWATPGDLLAEAGAGSPVPRRCSCRWSQLLPPVHLGLVAPGLPLRCGESGEIQAGAPAERCRPCSPGAPSDRQLNR